MAGKILAKQVSLRQLFAAIVILVVPLAYLGWLNGLSRASTAAETRLQSNEFAPLEILLYDKHFDPAGPNWYWKVGTSQFPTNRPRSGLSHLIQRWFSIHGNGRLIVSNPKRLTEIEVAQSRAFHCISTLHCLEVLSINSIVLSDQQWKSLLSSLSSIVILDGDVTADSLRHLAAACPRLKRLAICSEVRPQEISNDIVNAIRSLRVLRQLVLDGCTLDESTSMTVGSWERELGIAVTVRPNLRSSSSLSEDNDGP